MDRIVYMLSVHVLESIIVKESKYNVRWCARLDEYHNEQAEEQNTIVVS